MPTVTHTVSAAVLTRFQVAVGEALRLGRDATPAEVKDWHADLARRWLLDHERSKAETAALNSISIPDAPIT